MEPHDIHSGGPTTLPGSPVTAAVTAAVAASSTSDAMKWMAFVVDSAFVVFQMWVLTMIENDRHKHWLREDDEMVAEEKRKTAEESRKDTEESRKVAEEFRKAEEFTTELKLKKDEFHLKREEFEWKKELEESSGARESGELS